MRIRKVKFSTKEKKEKWFFEYETKNTRKEWDLHTLTCTDTPRPELKKSLQNLESYVVDICEIDADHEITVFGVSIGYATDKEIMGAVLIARRKLEESNSPMNLVTPYKQEDFNSGGGDSKQLMPKGMPVDVRKVINECDKYIEGDRAQQDLFGKPGRGDKGKKR